MSCENVTYVYRYVPVLVFLEILCHLFDQVNYSICQQHPVEIYVCNYV